MILNAKHILAHLIFPKLTEVCTTDIPVMLMGKLKNRTVKYFDYGYTICTPRVALELSHFVYRVCALDYYNSNSLL